MGREQPPLIHLLVVGLRGSEPRDLLAVSHHGMSGDRSHGIGRRDGPTDGLGASLLPDPLDAPAAPRPV